jgi:heme-degrading monooxygenase HmoA
MIGVLTHHWAKDGRVAEARTLLAGNGRAQSRAPGFVSRHELESLSDTSKVSSLVVWESDEIYDRWKASPERAAAMAGAEDLWARPPKSERFAVSGRLGPSA